MKMKGEGYCEGEKKVEARVNDKFFFDLSYTLSSTAHLCHNL